LNILTRYLLKTHLGPFLLSLALIFFLLLLNVILQMMDRLLSKGMSLDQTGQFLLYQLAWIGALAVPMAVLPAVLMTFGRLAADNEIIALKSSGISITRMLFPPLAAAAALTFLMILFNDLVLPDWNHHSRTLTANLKRRKAALVLKEKEGVFIKDLGPYSLLVRRVDEQTNQLYGITVYRSEGAGPPSSLHASSGEIHIFDDGSYIRLSLYDGEYHRIQANEPERFIRGSFARHVIHIEDRQRALQPYQSNYRGDREMDLAALAAGVDEYRLEQQQTRGAIDSLEINLAGLAADVREYRLEQQTQVARDSLDGLAQATTATTDSLVALAKLNIERQVRLYERQGKFINTYLVEYHKKFSIPIACLVFVLVGAPLGIIIRKRGAAVSAGTSLSVFCLYWMFLIGGEGLADRGFIPPFLAMWAPNLLFGIMGLYMVRVVGFDRPFLGRLNTRLGSH
jgi:lipopolysaccharide export system permease protein